MRQTLQTNDMEKETRNIVFVFACMAVISAFSYLVYQKAEAACHLAGENAAQVELTHGTETLWDMLSRRFWVSVVIP